MAKSRKHKLKNFRKKSRKVKTRRKYKKRAKKPTRKHPRRRKKRTMRGGVKDSEVFSNAATGAEGKSFRVHQIVHGEPPPSPPPPPPPPPPPKEEEEEEAEEEAEEDDLRVRVGAPDIRKDVMAARKMTAAKEREHL